MNKYCFVIELNEENVKEYVNLHKNPWPDMLQAIKEAGAQEEVLFIYNNLSIVFFICEDIDEVYRRLGEKEIVKKWDETVGPWIKNVSPCLEKIFDLNYQLEGKQL
jgi:L-rhamnose mutarotase